MERIRKFDRLLRWFLRTVANDPEDRLVTIIDPLLEVEIDIPVSVLLRACGAVSPPRRMPGGARPAA